MLDNFDELLESEESFDSGSMHGCVCVVVMFDKQWEYYRKVRGWHGAGSIDCVDFERLFANIPKNDEVKVIALIGPSSKKTSFTKILETLKLQISTAALQSVIIEEYIISQDNCAGVSVDREGNVIL